MRNNLTPIDELFHHNLDDLKDQPPAHIWDTIEKTLDNTQATSVTHKKTNKHYLLPALLLLVSGSIGIFIWNNQKPVVDHVSINKGAAKPIVNPETESNQVFDDKTIENNKMEPVWPRKDNPGVVAGNDGTGKEQTAGFMPQSIYTAANTLSDLKQSTNDLMDNDHSNMVIHDATTIPFSSTIDYAPAPFMIQDATNHTLATTAISAGSNTKTVKNIRPGRFSLTVFFAPDITTRNLEQDLGNSRDENKEEILRTEKNSALDYTIGARIEYAVTKHFSLQSGISFSSNTIDISPKTIFARYDIDGLVKYRFNCSSGYAFFKPKTTAMLAAGDSTEALASTSLLHYVNIPVVLQYNYLLGRRFNLFAEAGITARFITKQSIAAVYAIGGSKENNSTNEIRGLKTSYFNGVVGLGADYAISRHLAITLFPSFNFATSPINRNAPVKAYPNTVSIASGIKIKL